MNDEGAKSGRSREEERQPYRLRIPGFASEEDVGLGDAIKRATSTAGIRPCGGCERRAAALNRWFAFTSRRTR